MQTVALICLLLLMSYIFDVTAKRSRIPTIIFLLFIGWTVAQIVHTFNWKVPDLQQLLHPLGTVGLILIVLEGAMELKVERKGLKGIGMFAILAVLPIIIFSSIAALIGHLYWEMEWRQAMVHAIPFAIISSAIAIPSAATLNLNLREQITYESSISDIVGVLMFNFFAFNEHLDISSIGVFFIQLVLMILISALASVLLSMLLARVKHTVKFTPILIMLVLIYAVSKEFHLPALLFVLLFGLLLSNIVQLSQLPILEQFQLHQMVPEIKKFHAIAAEGAFIVRSLFFLLFGFYIDIHDVLDIHVLPISLGLTCLIFIIRAFCLLFLKLELMPTLLIAPRGLITILLFFTIPAGFVSTNFPKELLIQVVLLTAVIMMVGLVFSSKEKNKYNT